MNSVDDDPTSRFLKHAVDGLQALDVEAARALSRLAADFARAVAAEVERPLKPIPAEETAAVIARVRKAVAAGRIAEDLSFTDARLALRSFAALTPAEIGPLLNWREKGWRVFVDAVFRARTSISEVNWPPLAAVLSTAPPSVALVHGAIERRALDEANVVRSALLVARGFKQCRSLAELEAVACADGLFKRTWSFTALVFAAWVSMRQSAWSEVWDEVAGEPRFEGLLLPRNSQAAGRSHFAGSERSIPAGLPDDLLAQALFAATLLGQWSDSLTGPKLDRLERLVSILIRRDAFNDPRTFRNPRDPVESIGWQLVKKFAPQHYEAFVERLISADVELFFNQTPFDEDRRRFWLDYKKKIHRTIFCFSPSTRRTLALKLAGTHAAGTLDRARELHPAQGQPSAFCLVFESVVVVEFSEKGHAAFRYTIDAFEERFPKRGLVLLSHLKARDDADDSGDHLRMPHVPTDGWQAKFRSELRNWGIRPR